MDDHSPPCVLAFDGLFLALRPSTRRLGEFSAKVAGPTGSWNNSGMAPAFYATSRSPSAGGRAPCECGGKGVVNLAEAFRLYLKNSGFRRKRHSAPRRGGLRIVSPGAGGGARTAAAAAMRIKFELCIKDFKLASFIGSVDLRETRVSIVIPFVMFGALEVIQLFLGSDPLVVLFSMVGILVTFLPLHFNGRDLYSICAMSFGIRYLGAALILKTLYRQPLQSHLFAPFVSHAWVMVLMVSSLRSSYSSGASIAASTLLHFRTIRAACGASRSSAFASAPERWSSSRTKQPKEARAASARIGIIATAAEFLVPRFRRRGGEKPRSVGRAQSFLAISDRHEHSQLPCDFRAQRKGDFFLTV